MFKRELGEKAQYFWEESLDGELIRQSPLMDSREKSMCEMHKAMKECRVNGTVFQPCIKQGEECAEWGAPEVAEWTLCAVTEKGEDAAFFWTLDDAKAYMSIIDAPLTIMDRAHCLIFAKNH